MATVQTGKTGKQYTTSSNGSITVTRPDGTKSTVAPGSAQYNATASAMKSDGVSSSNLGAQQNPNLGMTPKSSAGPAVLQPPTSQNSSYVQNGLSTSASGGEDFMVGAKPTYNQTNWEDTLPTSTSGNTGPQVISPDNGGQINLNTGEVAPTAQQLAEQLKRAQLASRISALDKARNNALNGLESERSSIAPMFYNKRNQAAANNDIGAMNFAQYMASRGIKGNAGAMPEIYRNNALQGQLGALDQAETSEMARIERDKQNVNEGYNSDVVNANADVEATALQNILSQMNADRSYNLQTKQYNDSRVDKQKAAYADSINAFYGDFQAEINKVKSDGDPSNDWQLALLEAARQKKIQELAAKQQETAAKTKADALAMWKEQGVADENIARILGIPVHAQTKDYRFDNLNYELNKRETDYETSKPYYNPNTGSSTKGQLTYKDYVSMGRDMLDKGYQATDMNPQSPTYGQATYSKVNTPEKVVEWIKGLSLTPEDKAKLANDLGV